MFDYLELGLLPPYELAERHPTLSFEQIYATLTYYWRNQGALHAYLHLIDERIDPERHAQRSARFPTVQRLREMLSQRGQAMQEQRQPAPDLEDYFDFLAPHDIRIKGSRIGIETILRDYLDLGLYAEDIALRYRTISLEEVYATLTYYWRNQEDVDAYMWVSNDVAEQAIAEQERNPNPALLRLRAIQQQRKEEQRRNPPPAVRRLQERIREYEQEWERTHPPSQ